MPGTNVDATLNSTPLFLGTMLADNNGVVTGTFAVPANVATGAHTVTLVGTGIAGNVGQTLSGPLTIGAFVQAPTTTTPPVVGTLPTTGSETMTLTAMAFLLLSTGAALVLVTRRRATQR
jgi:LPXTG-motif cell wall-anchored protein